MQKRLLKGVKRNNEFGIEVFVLLFLPIFFVGCDLTQTFYDKETGFSIKFPKNWETMGNATEIDGLSFASSDENTIVYMDPFTWSDMFTFAKLDLSDKLSNKSEEKIFKEVGLDMGMKIKMNGHTVYTFVLPDIGGFYWIQNSTLYFACIQVYTESLMEPIYKSARFKR